MICLLHYYIYFFFLHLPAYWVEVRERAHNPVIIILYNRYKISGTFSRKMFTTDFVSVINPLQAHEKFSL